jgi:hypothetical protein
MYASVTHDRQDESMEAKVRWFRSLTIVERMEILCWFTDLALELNPKLPDMKDAQPIEGSVQVLTAA